ncbi:MAG: hypothetical protein ACNYPI_04820 [Arenicellales bacterium WSBS_2016_MAG_OTU3]
MNILVSASKVTLGFEADILASLRTFNYDIGVVGREINISRLPVSFITVIKYSLLPHRSSASQTP